MSLKTPLAILTALALCGPALAQDTVQTGPVVVELFTSQGCAACPPADALLAELANRDDVIALSLHVDYWDYIGWADTFAAPEFTQRQYGYGRAAGSTMVYTPQMIVGGQDVVAGSRSMAVADLIQAHQAAPYPVTITIETVGGAHIVRADATMPPPRPEMVVQLVSFTPHQLVDITRGERAGSSVDFHNIVTTWQAVADWDGAAPLELRLEQAGDSRQVVIVQVANYGPVVGAARVD